MAASLADLLRGARVYDLEQPRFRGMPTHPAHQPGYFYALHRRHRDAYRPADHGPRSSASGALTMVEHSGTHTEIFLPLPQASVAAFAEGSSLTPAPTAVAASRWRPAT